MNINPISFGKTMRVVGNNSIDSAYRVAQLMNGCVAKTSKEAEVQRKLWRAVPDASICAPAQVLSLNYGKDVFVVTGAESKKITALIEDKNQYIDLARANYQNNKELLQTVIDSENNRFERLAGNIAFDTNEVVANPVYSEKLNAVETIDFIA